MTAMLSMRLATVRAAGRTLVDALDLDVPERGLVGLVGPNGAGKSTVLRAAAGLQPLCAGDATLAGRPLARWPRAERARRLGYLPQSFDSHWDLTVAELLALALAPPSAELLARCELDALLARRFATLSGGERARALLARTLAHDPPLLLADEPAAHLDIPHQHRLMALLAERARLRAVVVVLHDLHLAAAWCDRVALLAGGRLLADGPPSQVLTEDLLARAYGHRVQRVDARPGAFFTSAAGGHEPVDDAHGPGRSRAA